MKLCRRSIEHYTRRSFSKKLFQQKLWISVDTTNKVQERKKAKQVLNVSETRAAVSKAQLRYTEVHKEVKRSIRSDKRNYMEQLATEGEETAGKGNLIELYKITKTFWETTTSNDANKE